MAKRKSPGKGRAATREKVAIGTQLRLWVMAAGRCQFPGCPDFLLRDNLTLSETNFSNVAHVVAASRDGPRGDHSMPLAERARLHNLMLMCTKHHKLIDSREHRDSYTVEHLVACKVEHEKRMARLTAVGPKNKSAVVRLRGRIGGREVQIPAADIRDAMFPLYPIDDGVEIDLTGEPQPSTAPEWRAMAARIDVCVRGLHDPGVERDPPEHVSAFGLAAIPLLVHLGRAISDKVPTTFFQHHRGTEGWRWEEGGELATFQIDRVQAGEVDGPVGLVLSISGKVDRAGLPVAVRDRGAIYELRLTNNDPSPTRIRTRNDLLQFTRTYLAALARIQADRPGVREVHLFAAAPAAVAMACGHELIEKAHPTIITYEFHQATGFTEALKENGA